MHLQVDIKVSPGSHANEESGKYENLSCSTKMNAMHPPVREEVFMDQQTLIYLYLFFMFDN